MLIIDRDGLVSYAHERLEMGRSEAGMGKGDWRRGEGFGGGGQESNKSYPSWNYAGGGGNCHQFSFS